MTMPPSRIHTIVLENRSYRVRLLEQTEATALIEVDGVVYQVPLHRRKQGEPARSNSGDAGLVHATGLQTLRSPLPGLVSSIAVSAGEVIPKGGLLMTIEAMKMENPVPAPVPARILKLLTSPGAQVKAGQALLEFECV